VSGIERDEGAGQLQLIKRQSFLTGSSPYFVKLKEKHQAVSIRCSTFEVSQAQLKRWALDVQR
jgi:hypothetical protein